jgi:plastocyanin
LEEEIIMKRFSLLSTTIVLALLLSSCSMHLGLSKLFKGGSSSNGTPSASSSSAPKTPAGPVSAISIKSGKYRPKNVTIKVGSTLTWTNNDDVPESVTSDAPGLFDSGTLAPGATWSYTFTKAGVFPYHSTGKNGTYGTVTVQ